MRNDLTVAVMTAGRSGSTAADSLSKKPLVIYSSSPASIIVAGLGTAGQHTRAARAARRPSCTEPPRCQRSLSIVALPAEMPPDTFAGSDRALGACRASPIEAPSMDTDGHVVIDAALRYRHDVHPVLTHSVNHALHGKAGQRRSPLALPATRLSSRNSITI